MTIPYPFVLSTFELYNQNRRKSFIMKKICLLLLMTIISIGFIFAVDFDADTYSDSELREIRDVINHRLSESKKGEMLYEDDNISISYLGWKEEYGEYSLWLSITNHSDYNLLIGGMDTCINECSVDCSNAFAIMAGKRKNAAIISIYDFMLEEQWIDEIEYVEFGISYFDDDNWDGINVDIPKRFTFEYCED